MGYDLSATKSKLSLHGSYGGFARLRTKVAKCLDEEFGEHYKTLFDFPVNYEEFDKKANEIAERKQLKESVLDFLFQPDCEGKITPKQCRDIYEIIKDDNEEICLTYFGDCDGNNWQTFKDMLQECYKKRWNLYWA